MISGGFIMRQLWQQVPCELFAQLDPPLVEAEDIPDDSLNEDFMFVHGDEASKRSGGQTFEQDRV